jgi:hypothetical protein
MKRYSCNNRLKKLYACIALLVFFLTAQPALFAQTTKPPCANDPLFYYHELFAKKPAHPYIKIDYSRPNNQLMSWPNYPLTAAQIAQRDRNWKQENKVSSRVAKDIITSFLSKKKPVAVIPKF